MKGGGRGQPKATLAEEKYHEKGGHHLRKKDLQKKRALTEVTLGNRSSLPALNLKSSLNKRVSPRKLGEKI